MFTGNLRYAFYILIALMAVGLLVAVYFVARRPIPPSQETTNEYHTTIPVETRIIRERVPARVETLYVDGHPYEYSVHNETMEKDKVKVDLSLGYDEYTNQFDIDANITAIRDSIYVEKEIVREVKEPRKFIALTAAVGAGFTGEDGINPEYLSVDAGVKVLDKYRITAFADTRKTFGVRVGVDF